MFLSFLSKKVSKCKTCNCTSMMESFGDTNKGKKLFHNMDLDVITAFLNGTLN